MNDLMLSYLQAGMTLVDAEISHTGLNLSFSLVDTNEFVDPFFQFTIDRLRPQRVYHVEIRKIDLARWAEAMSLGCLKGLIFQVGRCGSTAYTNIISKRALVFREPTPLLHILVSASKNWTKAERCAAIKIIIACLSSAGRQAVVIKLVSWAILFHDEIVPEFRRRALITRSPTLVAASMIAAPPAWASWMITESADVQEVAASERDLELYLQTVYAACLRAAVNGTAVYTHLELQKRGPADMLSFFNLPPVTGDSLTDELSRNAKTRGSKYIPGVRSGKLSSRLRKGLARSIIPMHRQLVIMNRMRARRMVA